jgi:hypothetical protein
MHKSGRTALEIVVDGREGKNQKPRISWKQMPLTRHGYAHGLRSSPAQKRRPEHEGPEPKRQSAKTFHAPTPF